MTNLSDNTAPLEEKRETQKYLFDTDFDYSETSDDVQSITPKQLAAANTTVSEQSYKSGHDKGVQDINESIARTASDQLFVITAKIDELIEAEKMILETFHVQVAQVCELITSKIMPTLCNQGALEEVKAIIDKAYGHLPAEQEILVEVHGTLLVPINEHISNIEITTDNSAQVKVKAGENFELSDCKISWAGAGIEHYTKGIINEVQETLLRLSGEPSTMPKPAEMPEEKTTEQLEEKGEQDV